MPHINEQYDFVITVFIVFEKSVLFVNHPRYNKWLPMGGHIELNEDPEEALFREIQEETGLEVEILSSKPALKSPGIKFILTPNNVDVHEANAPHKHISFTYFAKAKNDKFMKSAEHTELIWVHESELDSPKYDLYEAARYYAREAIKKAQE